MDQQNLGKASGEPSIPILVHDVSEDLVAGLFGQWRPMYFRVAGASYQYFDLTTPNKDFHFDAAADCRVAQPVKPKPVWSFHSSLKALESQEISLYV